jgi:acetyl-CoA carboxylase carboxyltransferase component
MGAAQLAGVLSIVARKSAAAAGRAFDTEADERARAAIEAQIDEESHAFFVTARLYDDGLIDPRDTRTVLGIALSTAHSNIVAGQRGYGVFRM